MYARLGEAVEGSAVALSRAERDGCFERLLLDDDDECKELIDVLGRRLRFAKALFVLSRARAARDNLLFFAFGGLTFSLSRILNRGYCVLGSSGWAVFVSGCAMRREVEADDGVRWGAERRGLVSCVVGGSR